MAEPNECKRFHFAVNENKPTRLHSIGYDDYRFREIHKFAWKNPVSTLHYVRNGSGKYLVFGKEYNIKAGDFFFTPSNVPIAYYPNDDDLFRYYFFTFQGDYTLEIKEALDMTNEQLVCRSKNPQQVKHILDSLFEEAPKSSNVYYKSLSVLMQILSLESNTSHTFTYNYHKSEELVTMVKEMVKLNFANPEFTVSSMAQMLYISNSQMTRVFKSKTGTTVVAYLMKYRMQQALVLLEEKDLTNKELSHAVGFRDELYFMKCFKKEYGITVNEYKRNGKF